MNQEVTSELGHLKAKAQRGDLLFFTPRTPSEDAGLATKTFAAIYGAASRAVQGDYTHSAIYAGKGKVLDLHASYGGGKIVDLQDIADAGVVLARPEVPRKARQRAADLVEKAITRGVKYDTIGILKALVATKIKTEDTGRKIRDTEICSSIIAKAYGKRLVPEKSRDVVTPSDLFNAPTVSKVVEFRARGNEMPKTAQQAMAQGFADSLTKEAFLPALAGVAARVAPALAGVGRAVVGGGMRAANAAGMGQQATSLVRKGLRASPNLMRNVGAATVGAGALGAGALGTGYVAGRMQ